MLNADYGKTLATELHDLGIADDVVLGLYSIPDQTDVENLRLSIESGETSISAFAKFCKANSLPADLKNASSGCQFLEYEFGRRLAWIHLPDGDEVLLRKIVEILRLRSHVVKDPDTMSII